jgi:hypothetical protein
LKQSDVWGGRQIYFLWGEMLNAVSSTSCHENPAGFGGVSEIAASAFSSLLSADD